MAPVLHMLAGEPGEDNPKLRKAVCRLTVYVADHCMERFLCRYYKGAYPEMDRMAGSPLRRKLTDEEVECWYLSYPDIGRHIYKLINVLLL